MTGRLRIDPAFLAQYPLPPLDRDTDKKQRGRVLVIGGSRETPGAALLAGVSALRAGAGNVRIATAQSVAGPLAVAFPEARVIPCPETAAGGIDPVCADRLIGLSEAADAIVIGPGMLDEAAVQALAVALLRGVDGPHLLVDAAAFTELRGHRAVFGPHRGRVVVTPHAGEMARFLRLDREAVEADPASAGKAIAEIVGGPVAAKGSTTHVLGLDGEDWVSDHGVLALGTSGSGDTLAGIVAALLARGATPIVATAWGVYLHAEAGHRLNTRHGPVGLLAREIPAEIPRIMADVAAPPAR